MAILKRSEISPESFDRGRTRYLTNTDNLMMVVCDFQDGPMDKPDPPHSHPHEQISYVAGGKVNFFLDGKATLLEAGDMVNIPSNIPHSIQLMSKQAKLVDAFHPIREDFLK